MVKHYGSPRHGLLALVISVLLPGVSWGQAPSAIPNQSLRTAALFQQRAGVPQPTGVTSSSSGVQPLLPVMPPLEPRPAETPDQQFHRTRSSEEAGPTSGFANTVNATDTVIELVVGQGRVLTARQPIPQGGKGVPVISVGEPSIIDFDLMPDPRMLRITGKRVGVTDLTFITADGQVYSYEVHVLYDLPLISAQLSQVFPDAQIQLTQLREHVVVKGEARSSYEVTQILQTLNAYLSSVQTRRSTRSRRQPSRSGGTPMAPGRSQGVPDEGQSGEEGFAGDEEFAGEEGFAGDEGFDGEFAGDAPPSDPYPTGFASEDGARPNTNATAQAPQVINLLRVPSTQQVLLKVQIAELSRRAVREIGVDLTYQSESGTFLQSIATGSGNLVGVFPNADFDIVINALRRNSVATILAEPNLVTSSGYPATFQSGGEFPVPVGSISNLTPTVEFKRFGVLLSFLPYVQDDGVIRLTVQPEVSNVDEALSVSIVEGGDAVPGLRTRNASTTVDLREGQTLAIAGLLNRDSAATTSRVPFLGDIPYFGMLFSDRTHRVDEQELLVVVTPQLVTGMNADQRPPLPGQCIMEPDDIEFYLLNRIEGAQAALIEAPRIGIVRFTWILSVRAFRDPSVSHHDPSLPIVGCPGASLAWCPY